MNRKEIRVLLIEDDADDALLMKEMLTEIGRPSLRFALDRVERLSEGVRHLEKGKPDVVLLDLSLPDSQGMETFTRFHAQSPEVPIVVLTGFDDDVIALEAVRQGAQDYLVKFQVDGRMIARVILYAIERKRLQQVKDEFVSTVSHELRTPLAIIKGAITNLKAGILGPLEERQRQVVEMTARNVDRLSRLINDLLDLSRLESGKARINRRGVNFTALIEEVLHGFQETAKDKAIVLEKEIGSIPHLSIDPDMITQVLTNLLSNALRFAKSRVTVRAAVEPSGVRVTVRDDGPGIREEEMEKLFNKFEQIGRPVGGAGYKGTGLGLAISKRILELHQGQIWAESRPGEGAEFHFILP